MKTFFFYLQFCEYNSLNACCKYLCIVLMSKFGNNTEARRFKGTDEYVYKIKCGTPCGTQLLNSG